MALLEIDLQGARQVRATMPDALFVFLGPPSWDELVRRLVGRGTEADEERQRRLETALEEMAAEASSTQLSSISEIHAAAEELVALMRSIPSSTVIAPASLLAMCFGFAGAQRPSRLRHPESPNL